MSPSLILLMAALRAALALVTPSKHVGHWAMPHVAPAAVGMSAERLAVIDRVMANAIAAGGFPGAAVVIGRHGAIVWERGYGTLDGREPVDPERTLYDLASVTKVAATSASAMVLVDRGRLRLDDPVGRWLPEFRDGARAEVTVRDLLTHTSGLPAGRELPVNTPAEARRLALRTPLEAEPGDRVEYSDVGPIVLGAVIERVSGTRLDHFARRALYVPLGMRTATFLPAPGLAVLAAPTASDRPRGTVHDPMARALGGVAGDAGLFATAGDLAVLAQTMLNGGRFGPVRVAADSTVARFTRRASGRQALGWETCAGGGSCGRFLGPSAYGHNGYTGTSLWIDPERDLYVIVLTNWVRGRPWGGVAPVAVLHDVRSDVADVAALAVTDGPTRAMPERMRSDARVGW